MGGAIFAKQICHGAKRSLLASFRNKRLSQINNQPVILSLSNSHRVMNEVRARSDSDEGISERVLVAYCH